MRLIPLIFLIIWTNSRRVLSSDPEGIESKRKDIDRAFCALKCTTDPYCPCQIDWSGLDDESTEEVDEESTDLKYVCGDENSLGFQWSHKTEDELYVVEMRSTGTEWSVYAIAQVNILHFKHLRSNTHYQIRVWTVTSNGTILSPYLSEWTKTKIATYQPFPPKSFNVTKWVYEENDSYTMYVVWTPEEDLPCRYYLTILPINSDYLPFAQKVEDLRELYSTSIANLPVGLRTNVNLVAEGGYDSKFMQVETTSPSCIQTYKSLYRCVPEPPQNVTVDEKLSKKSKLNESLFLYDVRVSWLKQEYIPDYYTVSVSMVMRGDESYSKNVTGTDTEVFFYDLPLTSFYDVSIRGFSPAGRGERKSFAQLLKPIYDIPVDDSNNVVVIAVAAVFASLGFVTITAGLIVLYKRCRFKKDDVTNRFDNSKLAQFYREEEEDRLKKKHHLPYDYYTQIDLLDDEYKLISNNLEVGEVLGEGAFGVVYKGAYKQGNREIEVAVKMLKDDTSPVEMKQFQQEIDIMKSVGKHDHIVCLIGCCIKAGYWSPLLVTEYCHCGNLHSFLTMLYTVFKNQTQPSYNNIAISSEDAGVENKLYEMFNDREPITSQELISYARQIAMGMEYLASLRVVHRDLAARNVLMCPNRLVKVADFGLSRDIYMSNIYTKVGAGRLPVKWMAIESLTHQHYTTQSDVWSYGIVLWEISTLGEQPYPTLMAAELLKALKTGYRMECPKNCGDELYQIMLQCWKEDPQDRPTFGELRKKIENLLETSNNYIELSVQDVDC